MKYYLIIGGILNVLLALFHFMFWSIFDWPNTIKCLSNENQGILEVTNIHLAITILFFGYISIFKWKELLYTHLGKLTLLFISFFYFLRFINEFLFWEIDTASFISAGLTLIFVYLYFIPLILTRNKRYVNN